MGKVPLPKPWQRGKPGRQNRKGEARRLLLSVWFWPALSCRSITPAQVRTLKSLELKLQGELEVALQVLTEKGSISNMARVGCRVSWVPNKTIGLVKVHMIEHVH